jgi:HSP20 family protein
MNPKKFKPATFLRSRDQFISNFDDLFNKVLETSFPEIVSDFGVNLTKHSYPKVDVIDNQNNIEIIAEIPGYGKEDINIEYENGSLTISGASRNEKEDGSITYLYRELKRSSFSRSFGVDENTLNVKEISAKFENGILNIEIPKIIKEEASKKQTISIQ